MDVTFAPNDTSTIDSVFAALMERPQGAKLMVARDLNVNLSGPEGYRREEEITPALKTAAI